MATHLNPTIKIWQIFLVFLPPHLKTFQNHFMSEILICKFSGPNFMSKNLLLNIGNLLEFKLYFLMKFFKRLELFFEIIKLCEPKY